MKLQRWVILAGAAWGLRSVIKGRLRRPFGGLAGLFDTREAADLAVEHIVQKRLADRAEVFVEPVAGQNSVGLRPSGGDAGSGGPGEPERIDAPLNGGLRLTTPSRPRTRRALRKILQEAGAVTITDLPERAR